jgi:hypothetical protein
MKLFLLVLYISGNLVWNWVCPTPEDAAIRMREEPHRLYTSFSDSSVQYVLYELNLEQLKEIDIPEIKFESGDIETLCPSP